MSVNVNQIVVSDKFKHSDEGYKYFIGYQEDEMLNHYAFFTYNECIHQIFLKRW